MFEYKEQNLLGGWSISVLLKGAAMGHIRKQGEDGKFVYYDGPQNQLNWSIEDRDLSALKSKVEASVK